MWQYVIIKMYAYIGVLLFQLLSPAGNEPLVVCKLYRIIILCNSNLPFASPCIYLTKSLPLPRYIIIYTSTINMPGTLHEWIHSPGAFVCKLLRRKKAFQLGMCVGCL